MACLGILGYQKWTPSRAIGKIGNIDNAMVAALVDFHKSQCYFSSTVQIVAIVLCYKAKVFLDTTEYGNDPLTIWGNNIHDSSTLVILATAGFLPTTLTLTCIQRYGRQSWYLVILITYCLSTIVLALSTFLVNRYHPFVSINGEYLQSDSCGTFGSIGDFIDSICGNSDLEKTSIKNNTFSNDRV